VPAEGTVRIFALALLAQARTSSARLNVVRPLSGTGLCAALIGGKYLGAS